MTTTTDVATNLRAIEDMAGRLEARAIDRANSRDGIVGGACMVELAYVGSLETWANRIDGLERRWSDDPNVRIEDMPNWGEAEDPDEFWPALEVIWWWTEDYRRRLGMDYDDPRWRPTLVSEAGFLRNKDVADWVWANEPKYDDYAADVERAKSKLENILIEGDRSERTPVVCDRCDDGRPLVRVYDDATPVEWTCSSCQHTEAELLEECPACGMDLPLEPSRWHSDAEDDQWKCMGCKHLFSIEGLDDARATQMRRTEPREWVSRAQAVDLLRSMGHQGRTAIGLVDLPEALGWRNETTRVRFVSWPEVWRSHLLALQAGKIRAEEAAKAKAHKAMCEEKHDDDCWIDGRGCSRVCPRGSGCHWFMCPVHARASA